MKKIILSVLIFCIFCYSNSFAGLTNYEKLLSKRVLQILETQDQPSNIIRFSDYGISYFQRIDDEKRNEIMQYIKEMLEEKKLVKGTKPTVAKQVVPYQTTTGQVRSIQYSKTSPFSRAQAIAIEAQGKILDYTKIQQSRMLWINDLRISRGLEPLSYDTRLEYSAEQWNKILIMRDPLQLKAHRHKRDIGDSFYNYKKIEQRFKDLGLEFVNIHRNTFVENVGVRRGWKCKVEECSDEVIRELRGIFDYFLAEEGTKNDAHFKSMVNPNFKIAGLAFDINPDSKKFYFTVHYATEILEKTTE